MEECSDFASIARLACADPDRLKNGCSSGGLDVILDQRCGVEAIVPVSEFSEDGKGRKHGKRSWQLLEHARDVKKIKRLESSSSRAEAAKYCQPCWNSPGSKT